MIKDTIYTKGSLRQKAEDLLKIKSIKTDLQLSESETLKVIHELQVHQIELEMQNEELLITKKQAEVATQKYVELYDFAPSGYFTLSNEGEIIELNLCGAQMLGKERLHLLKSRLGFFVPDEAKTIFNLFLSKIFSNRVNESCEVILLSANGLQLVVRLNGIISENEQQCFVTMIDVTEQKQAEEAIRIKEERYRMLLELATDSFFHGDKDGNFITVNSVAIEQTGFSRYELLTMNMKDLFANKTLFENPLKYEQLIRGEIVQSERELLRKDKNLITVEMNSRMMPDGTFQSFFRDITERKLTEKALKRKLNEMDIYYELAITRERKMIALKSEINMLLERLGEKLKY